MEVKQMFSGSACAGVVAGGVASFFIGFVMLIWGVWDIVHSLATEIVVRSLSKVVFFSILIWLWGWYALHSVWKTGPVRRSAAYRVATLLVLFGIGGTFFAMIRLFLL